jgi:DNA modification methylase
MTFFPELKDEINKLPEPTGPVRMRDVDLLIGDCHAVLETIADESVALVLFSPPYDELRRYGGSYSFNLHKLGGQIYRILRPGGVCVMVIQDQTIDGAKSLTTMRTIVDWVDNQGFRLFETLIYSRHGAPGGASRYRFRVDHEYMPVFLKGEKPAYFEPSHMATRAVTAGVVYASGAGRRGADGKIEYSARKTVVADMKSRGTIWHYDVSTNSVSQDARIKHRHPATYSDRLAYDHVMCWAEPGAMVVDPFIGSGTTAVTCLASGRKCIGIDVNPEYIALAEARCRLVTAWEPAPKRRKLKG